MLVTNSDERNYEPPFLPNFYIIGAQKSGTTTLANTLSQNGDVCMSSPKEPRFFECEYPLGLRHYVEKYFSHHNGEKNIGEARVFNMMIPYVSDRIKETTPDAKIIVILHNPIERTYSAWKHFSNMRPGREPRSFEQIVSGGIANYNPTLWTSEREYVTDLDPMGGPYHGGYIEGSVYYNLLMRNWIKKFRKIKILFLQDLASNPVLFYKDVCDFLEIEFQDFDTTPANVSKCPSGAKSIAQKYEREYKMLFDFFYDDVKALSHITNRDLIQEWLL